MWILWGVYLPHPQFEPKFYKGQEEQCGKNSEDSLYTMKHGDSRAKNQTCVFKKKSTFYQISGLFNDSGTFTI